MNIKYNIINNIKEKNNIKYEFKKFFYSIYNKELTDTNWNHQFINSPYNDSPLFLALEDEKIIGSSLMIAQKFFNKHEEGNYYLWTTSAISKEYRSKGVYAELLSMQRDYAIKTNKSFIFAFPNKLAYPVVKLFGGFKDLQKSNLVKTKLKNLDVSKVSNFLLIDDCFFNWRFEHQKYIFLKYEQHILIAKEYEKNLDILAIYKKNIFNKMELTYEKFSDEQTIITLEIFLKDKSSNIEILDKLNGTYFPIDKTINYDSLNINLLMSDVF